MVGPCWDLERGGCGKCKRQRRRILIVTYGTDRDFLNVCDRYDQGKAFRGRNKLCGPQWLFSTSLNIFWIEM